MGLYKNGGVGILSEYSVIKKTSIVWVKKRKGESSEDLIRRFRKKYSKSGITKELRDRMYFEKPSDKKRRKKAQRIRAIKKEEEKAKKREEKFQKMLARKRRRKAKNERRAKRAGSERQGYNKTDAPKENKDQRRDHNPRSSRSSN